MKRLINFIAENGPPITIITTFIVAIIFICGIIYFDDPKAKAAYAASVKYKCKEKKIKVSLKKTKYDKRVYTLNVCGKVRTFACDTGWNGCKSYGCYEVPQQGL